MVVYNYGDDNAFPITPNAEDEVDAGRNVSTKKGFSLRNYCKRLLDENPTMTNNALHIRVLKSHFANYKSDVVNEAFQNWCRQKMIK